MPVVTVVQGDITKQPDIDDIVNAANEYLLAGTGVSGAIFDAAGLAYMRAECEKHPTYGEGGHVRVRTGNCAVTGAGALPNRRVIHAVGPIYNRWSALEREKLLYEAHIAALHAASSSRSVAFPAISCGAYSYPVREAASIAMRAAFDFASGKQRKWATSLREIRFVLFDEETYSAFLAAKEALEE